MRSLFILALSSCIFTGCFSPQYSNGSLRCENGTGCPDSYHCASDSTCWKNGTNPVVAADMAVQLPADMTATIADDLSTSPDLALSGVKHQGEACSPSDTCDTGQCVDGYCCDSDCKNSCQACNVPGLLGVCSNVALGSTPVGSRSCNIQDQSTCGRDGKCNSDGTCRNWPSGTQCLAGTCDATSGNFSNPSTCNGAGVCVSNGAGNCAPYDCATATQCNSSCTDGSQCSGASSCVNGSCGSLPNGRTCTAGSQCSSGNCVDGYCCNSSCSSNCQACDVAGNLGSCTTVPAGTPHGNRSCTNQGMAPCGGSCNGSTADCAYASSTTKCGASCSSTTQIEISYCDGAGDCAPSTATTCINNYSCVGSSCLTTCSAASDCASGFGCVSGTCVRQCVFDNDTFDDGCVFAQ